MDLPKPLSLSVIVWALRARQTIYVVIKGLVGQYFPVVDGDVK